MEVLCRDSCVSVALARVWCVGSMIDRPAVALPVVGLSFGLRPAHCVVWCACWRGWWPLVCPAVRYDSARRSVILVICVFLLFALVLSLERYVVDGIVLRVVSEPGQDAAGCAKCHTGLLRRVSPSPPRQTNPGT